MFFDPNDNALDFAGYAFLLNWLLVIGGMTLIVLFLSLANLVLTRGVSGVNYFLADLKQMAIETFGMSPRRIWALARLTFFEAYRRKALFVFVVFALLFMFAGWFIGDSREMTADQVKVYISFVLTSMTWLTIPIVLLLGCFGIPEDIRLRSMHTVVTKPVGRIEIVIGRILGISLVGFLVLSVMAVVGYTWITRQTPAQAQSMLKCRVPKYGGIKFITREGIEGTGINVGDIWAYRQFIEGATKARALWKFVDVDESVLDAAGNLNLENSFSAFRSFKGDMTRPLYYDIKLINPDTKLSYTTDPQPVNEFRSKQDSIPRKVTVDDVQYDIIKDFVTKEHALFVEISCIDREQYIGMARPDLFIRMPEQPFWVGYSKAVLGIALTILLLSMIGVAASTVVKGPIAALLTFVLYLLSSKKAHTFIDQLVGGKLEGTGLLESGYRMVLQMAPQSELPDNPAFKLMTAIDHGLNSFLWLCKQIIPQMQSFNMNEFVANGFDVPFDVSILPSLLVTLAYVLPCIMLGYFALRVRELESK